MPQQELKSTFSWLRESQLTFCHDQFHTGHDVCIDFVNPDPVHAGVIQPEVFDFHRQSSSSCVHDVRSVSGSRSSATFWVHQNLAGAARLPTAPVLFTKQELFRVVLAREYKFTPNVRRDLCWITAELKSCYEEMKKKPWELWAKCHCFKLACSKGDIKLD